MDNQEKMIDASRVAEILGISESHAYVVIRTLNQELEKAGYLTIRGKVDYSYLRKRYFSCSVVSDGQSQ